MKDLRIDTNIVITDIEGVLRGIAEISGQPVPDEGTIFKFISQEENTRFYIDNKGNSKMQPEGEAVYLWLDSGFVDYNGNPIFISLINSLGTYSGYYYGIAKDLMKSIKAFFPKNGKLINNNLGAFRDKYEKKIAAREHLHIYDEQQYLLDICNSKSEVDYWSDLFEGIKILADDEPENVIDEKIVDEPTMTVEEEEITVGLLLDTIDSMQNYIDELLAEIEKCYIEDKAKIEELEEKNAEYKRALMQVRDFMEDGAEEDESTDFLGGHELLERKGKILILGATSIDINTMIGIAKFYGFEKKDFCFETDYKKVINFAGRINNGDKYAAIILGACPHKVAGLGDWSSIIEKCKQDPTMPIAFDARSMTGELKVTKESFKTVLSQVCCMLMDARSVA